MRLISLFSGGALLLAATPGQSQPAPAAPAASTSEAAIDRVGTWVTLGTRAGPVASPRRSQPANLLNFNGKLYLVDVGDGAAGQLIKVGVTTSQLDGVFISHLHFDHTGGLAAILGLRFQTNIKKPLKVFGPPGTRELVDGIVASMLPGATAGYGVDGVPFKDPRKEVEVVELRDGARHDVDGFAFTARKNSHYSFAPGSAFDKRFEALSFRFDLPGRSIAYTGDTGPSAAVEELAKGVDLLVAEMMDVDDTIRLLRIANPGMPDRRAKDMDTHLRQHHLLPKDVGELATRAGAKAVVVTHFAGIEPDNPLHFKYLQEIARFYNGPVVIAEDMEAF